MAIAGFVDRALANMLHLFSNELAGLRRWRFALQPSSS
jgi:hypothetical protein